MRNVVAKADTITEMARIMAVDPQVLERTITRYNAFAKSNSDPDFNKNCFTQTISLPPYYFGKERLFVHFCCGGIKFDRFARVLREDGSPIEGLFVAGEAAGGVHGHDRMGGVAMTAAFVFGRIAGREACRL
jgi:fumarate reductase flavoprotein subunit/urocanate reductase